MRAISTICILALAALTVNGAPIPKDKEKKVEEKLLGEWKLVKTDAPTKPEYTFTIHFKKDGVLEFHRQLPDQEANVSKGKYKTAEPDDKNKKGTIDWTIGEGDVARGELSKIITLTEDELVFEDPDGLKESFVRVKPKKKDEPKKDEPKKDEPKKDDK
jgi:uncharacterized protein (TIGR03066 family)